MSEKEKEFNNTKENKLADTAPIKVAQNRTTDTNQIEINDDGMRSHEKEEHLFSEFVKEQYQAIKENFELIFNKSGSSGTSVGREFQPPGKKKKSRQFSRFGKNPKSCFLNSLLIITVIVIIVGLMSTSFLIFQYFRIAAGLPGVDDLQQYASQFETTHIYDRNGNLIYEILDPTAGRRTYTPLENISPYVVAATIATEDKDFYTNPGFDPWGIIRALWQNYTTGRVVSGASTITQQLARSLLLSPEERNQVTTQRKTREIVLAAEITRKYSKDEIIELYLNEIYYGNIAYGIEAAAETYFNFISRSTQSRPIIIPCGFAASAGGL